MTHFVLKLRSVPYPSSFDEETGEEIVTEELFPTVLRSAVLAVGKQKFERALIAKYPQFDGCCVSSAHKWDGVKYLLYYVEGQEDNLTVDVED